MSTFISEHPLIIALSIIFTAVLLILICLMIVGSRTYIDRTEYLKCMSDSEWKTCKEIRIAVEKSVQKAINPEVFYRNMALLVEEEQVCIEAIPQSFMTTHFDFLRYKKNTPSRKKEEEVDETLSSWTVLQTA